MPEILSAEPTNVEAEVKVPARLLDPHVEDWVERWEWQGLVARHEADVRVFLISYEGFRRWRRAVWAWAQPLGMDRFEALNMCGYRDLPPAQLPWRDVHVAVAAVG